MIIVKIAAETRKGHSIHGKEMLKLIIYKNCVFF